MLFFLKSAQFLAAFEKQLNIVLVVKKGTTYCNYNFVNFLLNYRSEP